MLQISINILLVFHVFVSVLMLLVVLMQRPKSEGLGAAFGGGMTENIFGAQTTTVLTKFTVYLGCAFFALTLMLAILFAKQSSRESRLADQLLVEEAAVIPPDAATFVAAAGFGDTSDKASVVFRVLVDGKDKYNSGVMKVDAPVRPVVVDIAGGKLLELVVEDGGDGIYDDFTFWGEARLIKK